MDLVIYEIFRSVTSMAVASLLELLLWFSLEDYSYRKQYNLNGNKNLTYIILMITIFEITSGILNMFISLVSYIILYGLLSVIIERNTLTSLFIMFKNLKAHGKI